MTTRTPVALFVFKRPSTTVQVFEAIRQAKPSTLFIVANSPRPDRPEEIERCAAVRTIVEQVDWKCDVYRDYAETYLSCKDRISSGLKWVFNCVEEAILFEDDCIPDPSFFRFCEELLDRYRHDERVAMIAGSDFQVKRKPDPCSYYFSRYNLFWGWATWRRAIQHYDVDMKAWPSVRESGLLNCFLGDQKAIDFWNYVFQETYEDRIDTWEYQWILNYWMQNGLTIVPTTNLVTNIGFSGDSTHTTDNFDWRGNVPTAAMPFPLNHPQFMVRDYKTDELIQKRYYNDIFNPTIMDRTRRKLQANFQRLGVLMS